MDYIWSFLAPLVFSLGLTPLVRTVSCRLGMVDQPRQDRWHQKPAALMGGIGIFLSFFAVLPWLRLSSVNCWVLGGAVATFAIGLLDDRYHIRAIVKLLVQLAIALIVVANGLQPGIFPWDIANIALGVFWIVGIMNALNLLDNMDGLSSGVTAIASVAVSVLAWQQGASDVVLIALALMGASLGFLWYNVHPARIFMGDCGSLFLGYVLATTSLLAGWQTVGNPLSAFAAPVLILSVPIFDTTFVTFTRWRVGKRPWHGGKDHTSHRLALLMGHQKQAVHVFYGLGAIAGLAGILASRTTVLECAVLLAVSIAALLWFGRRLVSVDGCVLGSNPRSATGTREGREE